MQLVILSTPGGQVPAIHFEVEDTRLEDLQITTGYVVYTLVANDDGSTVARREFHFVNRTGFVLIDESSGDPVFDDGCLEIEGISNVFRGPADFEELDEEYDYPTDIHEMSEAQIASRVIR